MITFRDEINAHMMENVEALMVGGCQNVDILIFHNINPPVVHTLCPDSHKRSKIKHMSYVFCTKVYYYYKVLQKV